MSLTKLAVVISLLFYTASRSIAADVVPIGDYVDKPMEFGVRNLKSALEAIQDVPNDITIYVTCTDKDANDVLRAASKALPKKPEAFAIARSSHDIAVVGSDQNGAMYGCFELAERLKIHGLRALNLVKPIAQAPAVEFRAVNPFFTWPYGVDIEDWWFLSEDYWEGYLDQLARARFNWIDMHGLFDIADGHNKNLFPYFVVSKQFPGVGVEPELAKRNLAMLNKVIAMAKKRGINFALMSYSAKWEGPGQREHSYEESEENLIAYTREAVSYIIENCPQLDMIGFRLGESGMGAEFYQKTYIPAIKEANRPIDLYVRTWQTTKDRILELGKEFPGRFYVEIKYNGEHFGAPYIIQGGRALGYHSYFYQNYYSYPRNYKIIYQLRANGTHRIFYWGNPVIAARANKCSTMGGAIGLCIEQMDTYYPKWDHRHKPDSPNRWFDWQYERDWYWYNVWGRTAYNPDLAHKDEVWISMFEERYGGDVAVELYNALKWASKIVPDAYTSYCIGLDHRHMAPELEVGFSVKAWADSMPLDLQNIRGPREYAYDVVMGNKSYRLGPLDMANYLEQESDVAMSYLQSARRKAKNPTPQFQDLCTELEMLVYMGNYFAHKLKAATYFALMEESADTSLEDKIKTELVKAHDAWEKRAKLGDEHYQPFVEMLRMKAKNFTWSHEGKDLRWDHDELKKAVDAINESGRRGLAPNVETNEGHLGPKIMNIEFELKPVKGNDSLKVLTVTAEVNGHTDIADVVLRVKPLPSERLWKDVQMWKLDDRYIGQTYVKPDGLAWAVAAVDKSGNGTMWPNFRRETPYKIILPWNAPMPGVEWDKALASLEDISAESYSGMMVGQNASAIRAMSEKTRNAILDKVREGKNLVVFAQDTRKGWDFSWLGGGIEPNDKRENKFRVLTKHPITEGMPEEFEYQRVSALGFTDTDDSWTHLTKPSAIAVRKLENGHIVLVQPTFYWWITHPEVDMLLSNILDFAKGDSNKPLLVIDPGDWLSVSYLDYLGVSYNLLAEKVR